MDKNTKALILKNMNKINKRSLTINNIDIRENKNSSSQLKYRLSKTFYHVSFHFIIFLPIQTIKYIISFNSISFLHIIQS